MIIKDIIEVLQSNIDNLKKLDPNQEISLSYLVDEGGYSEDVQETDQFDLTFEYDSDQELAVVLTVNKFSQ